MKPLAVDVRTKSNITGPSQAMTLDPEATAHLVSVLTNLYADPIMAVIREYSTNGLDATREAGSSEPIRVTLPTQFAPHFVVEDFGIGMSTDTLLNHYSLYGRSDKRDSNSVVGMLGLGCKSALTYADTFTVTSRRDGIETVAIISKNDDGVGEVQIVDTRKTDKRNGTTVTVPVPSHGIRLFTEKAAEFYGYWDAGTVLVNGEAPRSVFSDGFRQIPGTNVWQKRGWATPVVLMGNVPYNVNSEILREFNGVTLIIKADIGDVSFAPSREELSYNTTTNKFLRETVKQITDSVQNTVKDILSNAKSGADAYKAFVEFSKYSFMGNVAWNWNGKAVPSNLSDTGGNSIFWTFEGWNSVDSKAKMNWRIWGDSPVLFIKNYNGKSIPGYIKQGLYNLSDDDNSVVSGYQSFVFIREGHTPPFMEWVDAVDWNDLSADIPKPTAGTPGAPTARTYRSGKRINSGGHLADYTPQKGDKFILVAPSEFTDGNVSIGGYHISTIEAAGYIPVLVYVREQAAFREDYTVGTVADVKAWLAAEQDKIDDAFYLDYLIDHQYTWLRGAKIDDPALHPYVNSKKALVLPAGVHYDQDKYRSAGWALEKAMKPYSDFVRSWSYGTAKPYIEVVNALYNYRKDN
jgi:hypothetical protein